MEASQLIAPDTLIVTVALEDDVAQVHTYEEMKAIYELEEAEGLQYMTPAYNFDLGTWQQRQFVYDYMASHTENLQDPASLAKLALAAEVKLEA
jgi:hypothetical protein